MHLLSTFVHDALAAGIVVPVVPRLARLRPLSR
jgi:hypothetical protein